VPFDGDARRGPSLEPLSVRVQHASSPSRSRSLSKSKYTSLSGRSALSCSSVLRANTSSSDSMPGGAAGGSSGSCGGGGGGSGTVVGGGAGAACGRLLPQPAVSPTAKRDRRRTTRIFCMQHPIRGHTRRLTHQYASGDSSSLRIRGRVGYRTEVLRLWHFSAMAGGRSCLTARAHRELACTFDQSTRVAAAPGRGQE
jgi:hypothetical protein